MFLKRCNLVINVDPLCRSALFISTFIERGWRGWGGGVEWGFADAADTLGMRGCRRCVSFPGSLSFLPRCPFSSLMTHLPIIKNAARALSCLVSSKRTPKQVCSFKWQRQRSVPPRHHPRPPSQGGLEIAEIWPKKLHREIGIKFSLMSPPVSLFSLPRFPLVLSQQRSRSFFFFFFGSHHRIPVI